MIRKRVVPILRRKHVAAYARVSTLLEQQEESYETQVEYYKKMIESTEGWELVDIYADQGITGTKATKRPQFMRMIQDARDGKIDIILCKSIARFSRNAGETQIYVQELKKYHVEVRFEKEGINTFDTTADFIFSIYAALAQEESRSISENVKWSYRRMAEQGIRHVGNNHMLGYDEIDGKLAPNKDAWIVRQMFEEYARGIAPSMIVENLNASGAHRMRADTPMKWSSVHAILCNEAYVGDRLLQKKAPQNYLTKKSDPTVEYESVYISGDHEGIVTREIWNAVQKRLKETKEQRERGINMRCTAHFLYGKVFCADCGQPYTRWTAKRAAGPYKTWRCRGRARKGSCGCRHIEETRLLCLISEKLGWEWKEVESFDSQTFLKIVDKVVVSNTDIIVILITEQR